jgi:hypothetical protein
MNEQYDVTALTREVEDRGYCVIPSVHPPEDVARARDLVEYWWQRTASGGDEHVPFLNRGHQMIYNLQTKDRFFLRLLFASPVVDQVMRHVLNDQWFKAFPADEPNYILRSYTARSGAGQLPMHIDSFIPYAGPYPVTMMSSIVLEDQDVENGCTVVVPGSHNSGAYTTQDAFDDAVPIVSRAGDVVIWDGRLWHGAHANATGTTRWALLVTYCRWWVKQAFDITATFPQEFYDELPPSQRAVLGFASLPYPDERYGIDMKRGYDQLPDRVADAVTGRPAALAVESGR